MTKSAPIGELRHRVVLQTLSNAPDSQGGVASTWSDLATVWALVEPTKSYERFFADRLEFRRTHTCIIRHRTDVTTTMRLSFDSRLFQIKGIRKPDERKFFLILDLEENSAT